MLTNAQLQEFLNLSDKEAKVFFRKVTPLERETYERMYDVTISLDKGIIPKGVIVCKPGKHLHDPS